MFKQKRVRAVIVAFKRKQIRRSDERVLLLEAAGTVQLLSANAHAGCGERALPQQLHAAHRTAKALQVKE